jgi:hypothetical protein
VPGSPSCQDPSRRPKGRYPTVAPNHFLQVAWSEVGDDRSPVGSELTLALFSDIGAPTPTRSVTCSKPTRGEVGGFPPRRPFMRQHRAATRRAQNQTQPGTLAQLR